MRYSSQETQRLLLNRYQNTYIHNVFLPAVTVHSNYLIIFIATKYPVQIK